MLSSYGGTRTNQSVTTPAIDVPYKYTGQELDSSTGLYDYGARQYDAALARFTSPDTIVPDPVDPQSLNRYAYAHNNPLRYIDPSGHDDFPADFPQISPVCFPCGPEASFPGEASYQVTSQYQQQYQQSIPLNTYMNSVEASSYGSGGQNLFLQNYQLDRLRDANDFRYATQIYETLKDFALGAVTIQGGGSVAAQEARALGQSLLGVGKADVQSGVWALPPIERGRVIEGSLGGNLPPNFPVIDRFMEGVVTSIKSLDLSAVYYQSMGTLSRTLTGYVDSAAAFNGRTWSGVSIRPMDIRGRSLDLAIPGLGSSAQQMVINQAVKYGAVRGVALNVIQYR